MSELPIVFVFVLALSILFFILGRISRSNSDEEGASANYTIAFILLIIAVLIMLVFLGTNIEMPTYDDEGNRE